MTEEGAALRVTRDLKAAISDVLRGYGDGQQAVTDASAELHRLCGCLEWLLQFDQKEQKRFLKPRNDYWDFLCTALGRQRADAESACFVRSQDKLKTPLGRGRAFIRYCLAHGQLAESLQLCLLDPELTRQWYGPRSPLVHPELREDLLDALYALNEVSFDLDLRRPDLDGAWPMFSESRCCNLSQVPGRRPRKTKDSPKEMRKVKVEEAKFQGTDRRGKVGRAWERGGQIGAGTSGHPHADSGALSGSMVNTSGQRIQESAQLANPSREGCGLSMYQLVLRGMKGVGASSQIPDTHEGPRGIHLRETRARQASCQRDAPGEDRRIEHPRSQQHKHLPSSLEKKREAPKSLISPQSIWEPEWKELQQDQETESPRTGICLEKSTSSLQGQGERAREAWTGVLGTVAGSREALPRAEGRSPSEGTHKGGTGWDHIQRPLASGPSGTVEDTASGNRQEQKVSSISGERQVLQGLQRGENSTREKSQERTGLTSATKEDRAVALQDVVKILRHELQKITEQAQHQEQLLRQQEGELRALQEQLSRCQEEKTQLQAELEQKQREAEQKDTMYAEELGGQRELIQAMKRRVLELIQEKDHLWKKVQRLSSVAPGRCVCCSKIFSRLSRRYPCRLCGGLVCHACSVDFKKREHLCLACTQTGEAQNT